MSDPVVFISSTHEDLREYRTAARKAVLGCQMSLRMSEYFPASGQLPTKDACISKVIGSEHDPPADVVVVIVAHCYGSVPEGQDEQKSYTWLECEAAVNAGIKLLPFVVDETFDCWPRQMKDSYPPTEALEKGRPMEECQQLVEEARRNDENRKKFKQWLRKQSLTPEAFTTPQDFEVKLIHALNRWGKERGHDNFEEQLRGYLRDMRAMILDRLTSVGIRDEGDFLPRFVSRVNENQRLTLAELVQQHVSLILLSGPGGGKSVAFYMMALTLAEQSMTSTMLLPVFIEAREVIDVVRRYFRGRDNNGNTDVSETLRQWLWRRLFRPFDQALPEELDSTSLRKCLGSRYLVLLVESFDEMVSPDDLGRPLTAIFAELLGELLRQLQPGPFILCVASRFEEKQTLRQVALPLVELVPLSREEVIPYVIQRWPKLPIAPPIVADAFVNHYDANPLYLAPLCHYCSELRTSELLDAPSHARLIDVGVNRWIEHNHSVWDSDGEHKRKWIRRLALEMRAGRAVDRSILRDIGQEILKATNDSDTQIAQLLRAVPSCLVDRDGEFKFTHLEYRDYFIANAVCHYLETGDIEISPTDQHVLLAVLEIPRVLDVAVQMIGEFLGERPRQTVRNRLIEIINDKTFPKPETRKQPSLAAAALSLLVRVFPDEEADTLNCSEQCFQRLNAAGQSFRGLRFQRASMRESDLRGTIFTDCDLEEADFDNADIRGATFHNANLTRAGLRNSRLGLLRCDTTEMIGRRNHPTDFSGACLEESSWFNLRVELEGYFQFWRGLPLADKHLLVSTSRGNLWLFDLTSEEKNPLSYDIHTSDLTGFDVDSGRAWVVTAGRDMTVQIHECNSENSQPGRFIAKYDRFSDYPRSVLLSESGKWLAITDRDVNVYFCDMESVEQEGEVEIYSYHTGPRHTGVAVCLERDIEDGFDVFYTAGYDGWVIRHDAPKAQGAHWRSRVVVDLTNSDEPGVNQTIRAISLFRTRRSGPCQGIFTGDEDGWLHYWESRVGSKPIRVEKFDKEIFSLAIQADGKRLAVGLSSGTVSVFDISGDPLQPSLLTCNLATPCKSIVRSLAFLQDDSLLAVSWAGSVRVWSMPSGIPNFKYDVDPSIWQPEKDKSKLRFDSDQAIDSIRGLSTSFRDYLKRLDQSHE